MALAEYLYYVGCLSKMGLSVLAQSILYIRYCKDGCDLQIYYSIDNGVVSRNYYRIHYPACNSSFIIVTHLEVH